MERREETLFKNELLLAALFLDPRFNIIFSRVDNENIKQATVKYLCELYAKIIAFEKKGLLNITNS